MGISIDFGWQSGRSRIQQGPQTRKHRTHQYSHCQVGSEFFLEQNAAMPISYMTAQGGSVRKGDFIDIDMPTGHLTFQVQEIEYYSQPADMWMAQLHEV